MKIEVQEEAKLRWPDGWPRTRVGAWQKRKAWAKSREHYRSGLVRELELLGAISILITVAADSRDPGVAVWFSMTKDKREWQGLLGLESPLPLLEEVDHAFQQKAKQYHPDNQDTGDLAVFQKYVDARDAARAWVTGRHAQRHDFVVALDVFEEVKWNINGLRLALNSLRRLKTLGMPSILERTVQKSFKAALSMGGEINAA